MKICTICKENKNDSEFSINNKRLGILRSACKLCVNKKARLKYNTHNEIWESADYFENIDTCEKAYFLGFIYADGCMMKFIYPSGNIGYRFALSLADKDEIIIDNFINATKFPNTKKYYIYNTCEGVTIKTCNPTFCKHLLDKGVVPNKTGKIRLPLNHLQNREDLIYSFILGFFDGDGSRSTYSGTICCSNIEFLEEIKLFLNLESNIFFRKNHWGTVYELYLPIKVFVKMYNYYDKSLDRKKIDTKNYKFENNLVSKIYSPYNLKIKNSQEIKDLYENNVKVTEIAKKYNVSEMTIYRHLNKQV